MSNIVAVENLKPGMVIVQVTKQNGPVKIRKSGLVTSDAMVQGLSEMGVQELEIDPEQTVEIAPAVQHRTQTQALLRGQHDTTAKFDKSLNEQFNRSLFLPTVEGLPSAWKVYGKQVATFAILIAGGLALGFTAATRDNWWPVNTSNADIAELDSAGTSPNQGNANTALPTNAPSASADEGNASSGAQGQPSQKPNGQTQGTQIAAQNTADQNASNQSNVNDFPVNQSTGNAGSINYAQPQNMSSTPNYQQGYNETGGVNTAQTTNRYGNTQTTSNNSDDYEGRVLNESSDQGNVSVSPELLARFNKAVEALDAKAESAPAENETRVTVRDDISRVDQLPVRLLTRLPSMNFSAHMYASRPADRWVRVNGRQMGEGDWIADKVQIINIEAQRVVLSFEDELFTMAALTDW